MFLTRLTLSPKFRSVDAMAPSMMLKFSRRSFGLSRGDGTCHLIQLGSDGTVGQRRPARGRLNEVEACYDPLLVPRKPTRFYENGHLKILIILIKSTPQKT